MQKEHIPDPKEAAQSQYEIHSKFAPANVSAPLCALVGFILVGSVAFAGLALTVQNILQVNHQNSSIAKLEQMLQNFMNDSRSGIEMEQVSMNGSTSKLEQRILNLQNTVNVHTEFQSNVSSEIRSLSSEIDRVSRSLSSKVDKIIQSLGGQHSNFPAASCSHIIQSNPYFPSGYYWIRSSSGSAVSVYCDFNRQCGCNGSSTWTRVAFINMSDSSHVCPRNWVTISSPVRTCGKGASTTGCGSVYFSTFGMTYSRVCGRITAYQYGTPDALDLSVNHGFDINSAHLDGISLTHGRGSRQHIWSFVCAAGEGYAFDGYTICACSSSRRWSYSTSFVGNDYFCDSGNHNTTSSSNTFYSGDPLWDGQGCRSSSTCCQFNNPPWFCKTLPQSTTDDLEVRICKNSINEDTPVQLIELYVQ